MEASSMFMCIITEFSMSSIVKVRLELRVHELTVLYLFPRVVRMHYLLQLAAIRTEEDAIALYKP
jgi:hypothetical protein